jgi:phosphoribosylamine---glycine ligase
MTRRPFPGPASPAGGPAAEAGTMRHGPVRPMVVGGGAREHAIAWSLARDASVEVVVVAPGSDAIGAERKVICYPDVSATDANGILELAVARDVDLVVVGPEAPLAAGLADALTAVGLPVFGPTKEAARLEWSKAFCREVAAAAGVRMARGAAFTALEPALAFARELAAEPASGGVVVKADGLAAGKGVIVCDDFARADESLRALFAALPSGAVPDRPVVVVEERLFGPEASLIAICDEHSALALPAARDHKRLLDDDAGPNTGGMGAYSPVPDLPRGLCATLVDLIHIPVLAEMARRGVPFRGALYAGLILTPEGPVLLEFNARFGDPEAQAILPRLAVPLGPLLLGAAVGELEAAAGALRLSGQVLPITGDAAVAIVLASAGYPENPRRGDVISGLDEAEATGALVFHAGTVRRKDGAFTTNGGRVLSVVGLGATIPSARANAEKAADRIAWNGMQRRRDIAAKLPKGHDDAPSPEPMTAADWGAAASGATGPETSHGRGGATGQAAPQAPTRAPGGPKNDHGRGGAR